MRLSCRQPLFFGRLARADDFLAAPRLKKNPLVVDSRGRGRFLALKSYTAAPSLHSQGDTVLLRLDSAGVAGVRVSERSLLPVVLPAKEAPTLVPRFRDALAELLARLGVPPAEIERERAEMADVRIGRTASRQILGSMNDFLRMLSYRSPRRSLLDESRQLAQAPCGPIDMRSPDDLTVEMLRHCTQ